MLDDSVGFDPTLNVEVTLNPATGLLMPDGAGGDLGGSNMKNAGTETSKINEKYFLLKLFNYSLNS
tara:strand:+ start:34865 stop:35062 length:198 start_codon:yes stop_codon:yes gene_type:complete